MLKFQFFGDCQYFCNNLFDGTTVGFNDGVGDFPVQGVSDFHDFLEFAPWVVGLQ